MYYSIYKNLRNDSWQCLLDANITSLPVDVLAIARFAKVRVLKNSPLNELSPGEAAKTYTRGTDWFIIYDDLRPAEESRFAIAHELGHIFLGHAMTFAKYSNVSEFGKKPKTEQQADMFALRLLSPACVLKGLELHSAQEIAEHCKIPLEKAELRSKRIKTLYSKNMFFTDPIELELFNRFKDYMISVKCVSDNDL